jgi:hypothetical protein
MTTTTVAARVRRPALLLASTLLASVTVAVASPGNPSSAATLRPLPSSELASPAIASFIDGRQDLFSRSSAGDLTQQYLLDGGSWRRPLNRGGNLASQPVTVSWSPGRVDAFARGTDNALWQRTLKNGSWTAWHSLGGQITSAPAATTWGTGRLDIFARNTNNALVQKTYITGTGWSGWTTLGGVLTSSPAATAKTPGRIDVVVRGRNDRGYHKVFTTGGGWSAWTFLGSGLTSQPAVASPEPGRLDVAVRLSDNRIWLKSLSSAGWSAWGALGTSTHMSGPSMTAVGDDVVIAAKRSSGYFASTTRTSVGGAWTGWQIIDEYQSFRKMATWVDVLDYPSVDPATAVPDMAARGVRTLFLATARFNSASDFYDEAEMGQWLDLAHAAGIKVIGWYVPAYGDMTRDVRRTAAINNYLSPGGQRFDAIGIDIERFGPSGEVSRTTFNARVVPHLRQVRALTSLPIGAIVPTPFTTNAGNNWTGFPWSGIGPNSEVVVPMVLWSFRSNYTTGQVYSYVKNEIDRTQALTGKRVHAEGGVYGEGSTPVTTARIQAFVNATRDAGAIGGSNYDYRTTIDSAWWTVLAGLNTL